VGADGGVIVMSCEDYSELIKLAPEWIEGLNNYYSVAAKRHKDPDLPKGTIAVGYYGTDLFHFLETLEGMREFAEELVMSENEYDSFGELWEDILTDPGYGFFLDKDFRPIASCLFRYAPLIKRVYFPFGENPIYPFPAIKPREWAKKILECTKSMHSIETWT